MEEQIRLQKYIAMCGIASRRAAEELIASGAVNVNGKTVTEQGIKINPFKDKIKVNGRAIKTEDKKVYIMLNKPMGYITTNSDDAGRKTVIELITDISERIYPVGRLDYETEGLLLLTNDGEFANALTHPSHNIDKEYIARVKGIPTLEKIKKLESGIVLDGVKTAPAKAQLTGAEGKVAEVRITIHEGKNRQVRKMFEAIGHEVVHLQRVSVGGIMLGHLALGKWRHLKKAEIDRLLLRR